MPAEVHGCGHDLLVAASVPFEELALAGRVENEACLPEPGALQHCEQNATVCEQHLFGIVELEAAGEHTAEYGIYEQNVKVDVERCARVQVKREQEALDGEG